MAPTRLTLSFTGSGVVGGKLPAGTYQLNFVGNGFVANGRAVDVANNGTQIGGFFEFEFTVAPSLPGDYDLNGFVEPADRAFWKSHFGEASGIGLQADGNGDGMVNAADYTVWRDHFNPAGAAAIAVAESVPVQQQFISPPVLSVAEPLQPAASSLTVETLDLAFIDAAFAGSVTTTSMGKAAGADAASLRIAAGGSAPFDRSLLLAARNKHRATGSERQEVARCAESSDTGIRRCGRLLCQAGRRPRRTPWAATRHLKNISAQRNGLAHATARLARSLKTEVRIGRLLRRGSHDAVYHAALTNQFEAALCMLNQCIAACPPEHWEEKIASGTFRWVAYHTLFYVDLYLSPSEGAFQRREFHRAAATNGASASTTASSRAKHWPTSKSVAKRCSPPLPTETSESLAGPSGFSWYPISRGELHINNIRHIQHHTGALYAYLRRVDESFREPVNPLRWIGSGWHE